MTLEHGSRKHTALVTTRDPPVIHIDRFGVCWPSVAIVVMQQLLAVIMVNFCKAALPTRTRESPFLLLVGKPGCNMLELMHQRLAAAHRSQEI